MRIVHAGIKVEPGDLVDLLLGGVAAIGDAVAYRVAGIVGAVGVAPLAPGIVIVVLLDGAGGIGDCGDRAQMVVMEVQGRECHRGPAAIAPFGGAAPLRRPRRVSLDDADRLVAGDDIVAPLGVGRAARHIFFRRDALRVPIGRRATRRGLLVALVGTVIGVGDRAAGIGDRRCLVGHGIGYRPAGAGRHVAIEIICIGRTSDRARKARSAINRTPRNLLHRVRSRWACARIAR